MIRELSANLYQQMKADLEGLSGKTIPQNRMLKEAILTVQKYLNELKSLVDTKPFSSEQEEIWFFKEEKPRFYRWLIFYAELLAIDNSKPIAGGEALKQHYSDQIRYINRFFRSHEFYYQYFRLNSDELDRLYFVRGASSPTINMSLVPQVDPCFGTGYEYLFSNFMAYEMLQTYLSEQLTAGKDDLLEIGPDLRRGKKLIWTGESINLIEVVYGLWLTGQVNNGEAGLRRIVEAFQGIFEVDLSRYASKFSQIKQRKGMSRTRFLEEMATAVIETIDKGYALK